MPYINFVLDCPYCGLSAKRVCYARDKKNRYAIYYCDECGGMFTLIYKH
jgi:transcription elongation factor Elf1